MNKTECLNWIFEIIESRHPKIVLQKMDLEDFENMIYETLDEFQNILDECNEPILSSYLHEFIEEYLKLIKHLEYV